MKRYLSLLIVLLVIPFVVNAAETDVVSLDATVSGGKISYEGTTGEESVAVTCKLYNSEGKEIDVLSSQVDEKAFTGSFTVTSKGNYEVACANYEGGDFVKKSVTVKEVSNPKTGDNIVTYVSLAVVSLVAILLFALKIKNSKKN